MIDELERALRDEFAARSIEVPTSPGLVDNVIGRAKRIRRRRRITAGVCSLLLLVSASATVAWGLNRDTTGVAATDEATVADARADGMSVLIHDEGADITNSTGDVIDTGLDAVYYATEVSGGWLLGGEVGDAAGEVVRYVSYSGNFQDLSNDGFMTVYSNERGDAAVVETADESDEVTVEIFEFTDREPAEIVDSDVFGDELMLGGMSGDTAWFTASSGDEKELALWSAGEELETVKTDHPVEPLAAVTDGLILADVSTSGKTLCPAVVDPRDGFNEVAGGECYPDRVVYPDMVAVSPDGGQVLVYLESSDSLEESESGEWVWMEIRALAEGFEPTGEFMPEVPVITGPSSAVFGEFDNAPGEGQLLQVIPRPRA